MESNTQLDTNIKFTRGLNCTEFAKYFLIRAREF